MEKLLLIYLAILLSACAGMSEQATLPILAPAANQADCDYEFKDVEDEDDSIIAMIDGKPVDGMVCYTSKGRLESKQFFKDGWEEGATEWYYEHSACDEDNLDFCKIETIAYNKQGLLNGRINKYYESGKLAIEATFLDGKRQGLQTDYYENGKLHSEVFFKADKQHGTATFYHESGGIDSIEQWVEGKAEGLAKYYYENGQLSSERFYTNSQKNGFAKYYYENGQLKSEEDYKDDELVGFAKYYYSDGALKYAAPVQYKPILDGIHNSNDLLKEYEALSIDERIAQKADFLKRIGRFSTKNIIGYALRDLNGDTLPELLTLGKDGVVSISTVRDGKLRVQDVAKESMKLTADGLFYKASCDADGYYYGCMSALKYKDYLHLTVAKQVYFEVALFGDSDIPMPNYIKSEDNEKVSITKDEYYELQKFYQNPPDQLKPDFVISPSNIFDDGDGRIKIIIDTGVEEYRRVLDELTQLGADSYALVDINDDNIYELLLGKDGRIASIYTKDANNAIVLVASFPETDDDGNKINVTISTDGIIFEWIQADTPTPWAVNGYKLKENAVSLTEIGRQRYDYIDPEDSKMYYGILVDKGRTEYIGDFDELEEEIDEIKEDELKITFIPVQEKQK